MTTDRLLTARELGEHLGLSTATILDRWEAGDLPGFRLFGRKGRAVRFRLSEIEAVLEGWREGPTGGASANQHHRRPNAVGYVLPTSTTKEE
jgi:predicted DNA-binding transcriptional regulator AlpA